MILDTNAFIWLIFDSEKLTDVAKRKIRDCENLYVSIASLWEIAIKQSIGKLDMIKHLPFHHRDPFDRLILAQAMVNDMPVITSDSIIPKYNVEVIW